MNEIRREYSDDIVNAVIAGRKIEAIKLLRLQHGIGLKEAKHEIDKLHQELRGDPRTGATMAEEGGAGGVLKLVIAVAALFALYWFYVRA